MLSHIRGTKRKHVCVDDALRGAIDGIMGKVKPIERATRPNPFVNFRKEEEEEEEEAEGEEEESEGEEEDGEEEGDEEGESMKAGGIAERLKASRSRKAEAASLSTPTKGGGRKRSK